MSVCYLYLDQKVLIELAQARLRKPGSEALWELRETLLSAVQAGTVVVPLSLAHYTETWSHGNRVPLSIEIMAFSRFVTLTHISKLCRGEIDLALHAKFGRPEQCNPLDIFGFGYAHANGMPELMLDKVHYTPEQHLLAEFAILSDPEEQVRIADVQRQHDTDSKFAENETRRAKILKEWRVTPEQLVTRFRIQTLSDLEPYFLHAIIAADVTREELEQLGSSDLEDLISAVPSLFALTEMRRIRYADPAQGFKRTDMNDLRSLSVAVPYCDVVVTDKAMADLLLRSKLPERYGTEVFTNITDAVAHLGLSVQITKEGGS